MKTVDIKFDTTVYKKLFKNLASPAFKKAAKIEAKVIVDHFKKDKWPLQYGFLLQDLFRTATGETLDAYLLGALCAAGLSFELASKDGNLCLVEAKKARRKPVKKVKRKRA